MPSIPPRRLPEPAEAVRARACRCGAPAGTACQTAPAADHVRRWLDALNAGTVTRGDVAGRIAALVVLTEWSLIPAAVIERAA